MKDIEISVKLALVIGWLPEQMKVYSNGTLWIKDPHSGLLFKGEFPLLPWRQFSYMDPAVIWPIAERYNVWPHLIIDGHNKGKWISWGGGSHGVTCDTAAKTVALAVITNYCKETEQLAQRVSS